MGVAVGVEHVADAELADGQHQTIGGARSGELVGDARHRLARAAQVDGLAQEQPLQARVGRGAADLIGFRAGETGDAERVGQAEALVDLGVHPQLAARPGPHAGIERDVDGFLRLTRRQAVGARIGRGEAGRGLQDDGRLAVDRVSLIVRHGVGRDRRGGRGDGRRAILDGLRRSGRVREEAGERAGARQWEKPGHDKSPWTVPVTAGVSARGE